MPSPTRSILKENKATRASLHNPGWSRWRCCVSATGLPPGVVLDTQYAAVLEEYVLYGDVPVGAASNSP